MSYLVDLTVRLAAGLGELPEALRQRHVQFILRAQNADGGFSGREGSGDLYYTGFACRSLAMLGELQGSVAERVAAFLQRQFTTRVAIIDFLSLVYSAMLLENAAGIDIFSATPEWRVAVASELERFRRDDGGYAKTDEGQSSSTYYTFLMVLCDQLIGREAVAPDQIVRFIQSRRRSDGGFVEMGPMQRSGTNPTAAALGTLRIFNAIDTLTRESAIDYLLDNQTDEGGLRANTRIPIADVLSTFTGVLSLDDLASLEHLDFVAARDFVLSMQLADGGFRGGEWDDGSDVEYTFYGLGGLALLAKML